MQPSSSLEVLVLFTKKKIGLSEKQFDEHWDAVLAALEAANNEKYRLSVDSKELP